MARQRNVIDVDDYEELSEDQSKSRRKNNNSGNSSNNANNEGTQANGTNPNNIDFNDLANMFQGIDMEQLSNMLGGLMGGFGGNQPNTANGNDKPRQDNKGGNENQGKSNINSGGGAGGFGGLNFNNLDLSQLSGMLRNIDFSQIGSLFGGPAGGPVPGAAVPQAPLGGDRRIQLLNAIKPMLTPERAEIIDVIMQMYVVIKILRG